MNPNPKLAPQLVTNKLEESSSILLKWFNNSYLKVSNVRSHTPLSGNKKAIANIDNNCIQSDNLRELLEIIIDSKLTFEKHINKLL